MLVARPILLLLLFAGGIVTVGVTALIAVALLAGSGGPGEPPGACRNSEIDLEDPVSPGIRDVITDPALAAQWQERWRAFQAQVAGGQGIAIAFEEGEVTSRASEFIEDKNIPLKHITICFYESEAEARATAEVPGVSDIPLIGGAFDTEVRARGSIDLSGEHPRVDITKLDAGRLPGFATGFVADDIESLVNEQLNDLRLTHAYDVTFQETRAEITVR